MVDINREISKVRAGLVLDHPFFGALTLHGELVADDSVKDVPHIDGHFLRLNPERFLNMRAAERKGECAAAFLACGLGHPYRRGERDAATWSKASAMLTGAMVKDSGMYLPDDWPQLPPGTKLETTIENLYTLLQSQKPKDDNFKGKTKGKGNGKGKGDGQGKGDDQGQGDDKQPGGGYQVEKPTSKDGSDKSPAELKKEQKEWEISTIQAAKAAKSMGSVPGFMKELLDQILNPKVRWQEILREFIELAAKNDYTWAKPNRRFVGTDFFMPAIDGFTLGRIGVFQDTSASVSRKELAEGYAEMNSMLSEFPGMEILYIQADTKVSHVDEFTTEDLPIVQTVHGRGGTSFKPPFNYCDREGIDDLTCAIYFTDGECDDFPPEPEYPVLWVYTQNPGCSRYCHTPPWGRLITIELDN